MVTVLAVYKECVFTVAVCCQLSYMLCSLQPRCTWRPPAVQHSHFLSFAVPLLLIVPLTSFFFLSHCLSHQADLLVNARVRIACELMDGRLPLPGKGTQ